MKFGKNLATQQSKFFYLRYLNYKELKKVIKHDAANSTCWFDLHLQNEIEAVNASFSHNVAHIQSSLYAVAEKAQAQSESVSVRLREVMRIADQVEILRRFAVWNAVAVVKILKKRTKIFSGPSPPGLGTAPEANFSSTSKKSGEITNEGTEQWLNKQLFFSGSDFAELQALLESLAGQLGAERLSEISWRLSPQLASSVEGERCPICLERCVDAVELSSCGHRFCWKCVVLGPIAFAPGEYRLSRCSVCRNEQPLDPTRNFRTVCSNQLQLLSHLIESDDTNSKEPFLWADEPFEGGLDLLYGSSGGRKDKVETEKERQTLDSIDAETGGVHPSTFFCSLCCEPLLLEAVTTTPCKHHFHRVCLEKHAEAVCPLCDEELPAHLVMGRFAQEQLMRLHQMTPGIAFPAPCIDHRFDYSDYPCSNCGYFTRSNLPPTVLLGPNGLEMPSYIHCVGSHTLIEGLNPENENQVRIYTSRTGIEIKAFPQSLIDEKRRLSTEFSLLH